MEALSAAELRVKCNNNGSNFDVSPHFIYANFYFLFFSKFKIIIFFYFLHKIE